MLKWRFWQTGITAVLLLTCSCGRLPDNDIVIKGEYKMILHSAENRFERGCPRLYVDGVETPPIFYALTDLQEARCRTELAQRNVKNFSEAGIDLVQCDWNFRDGRTR